MKRYSAHMKILEVQKLYKNEAEDLKILFSKLVRLADRCKSMMRFSFHTLHIVTTNIRKLFREQQSQLILHSLML